MTWYDDLKDVEDRVRELAKLPPTLARLQQAIQLVADATNLQVSTKLDKFNNTDRLCLDIERMDGRHRVHHTVHLNGDEFLDAWTDFPDRGATPYHSFERIL